ncbi:MAG: hypothetical protein IPQ17_02530 [Xanthomonadales bacterium]|nr:hypothetical protein [Xanthomonadales bacterium]
MTLFIVLAATMLGLALAFLLLPLLRKPRARDSCAGCGSEAPESTRGRA